MIGLWIGKLTAWFLRRMGRSGTSFPGKLALRFSPMLLAKLGRQLDRCIVVTGTNGKTTTTSLFAGMLRIDGSLITNAEGANLQQGLASVLLAHTSWFGRVKANTALFEIDEATLPVVAAWLPIRVIVVTNIFRDQLDRYGELDTTLQKILDGIAQTNAVVLLNGDDPLARHIGLSIPNPVHYFGMHRDTAAGAKRDQMRDGAFCLECGHALEYESFIYGQLGFYRCTHCDFCRPHPDFLGHFTQGSLHLVQGQLPAVQYHLPIRGLFNVYNAVAAIACARVCGLDADVIAKGLQAFRAPLGRMQVFATNPPTTLNLIKNPTGCDSVLQSMCMDAAPKVVCIAINDLAADGRDVSWLWDADFEWLCEAGHAVTIITSGLRAEDMAVRLKYAGYPTERLVVHPDLPLALTDTLTTAREHGGLDVYVLTTYTLLYKTAEELESREVQRNNEATTHRTSVS